MYKVMVINMKKSLLFKFIILIVLIFPICVRAENKIRFNVDSANITPSGTKKFDIIVDSDEDFTKVNFNLITTSSYVGFYSVEYNDSFVRNTTSTPGSNYELESSKPQKSGTVVASVTLVAKDGAPIGTEGYIRLTKASITQNQVVNLQNAQLKITISDKLSDNNYLSSLESSLANIEFNKDKLEYNVTVDGDVDYFDLKATAEDASASVTISDQSLNKTKNTITVTVKSEDGKQRVYKVNVAKKENDKTTKSKVVKTTTSDDDKEDNHGIKNGWYGILVILIIFLVVDVLYIKKKH